jgi:long-chain acyl-CoA synthetase
VVILPNSLELLQLYFASLLCKIKIAPLDVNIGEEYLKLILSQFNYDLIISDRKIKTGRALNPQKLFSLPLVREDDINIEEMIENLDFNDPWLITFTSGSTGVPKGVVHSVGNLMLSAVAFSKQFEFGSNNIFYHNLPMAYMAGILNLVFLPFVSGASLIVGERFSIDRVPKFWEFPIRYSANTFWFTPTIISILLKADRSPDGKKYVHESDIIGCVGTAKLPPELKDAFEETYGSVLYESYGLSETLFVSTNSPKIPYRRSSVGKPLDGVEISVDQDGEILIDTPWMFQRYINVNTEEHFVNGKFRSGDVGMLEDGFLWITSRKKYLINKGGVKISPISLENLLITSDIFKDFAIFGFPDAVLGEKIVCAYVPSEKTSNMEIRKLNLKIKEKMGKEFCIDQFVHVSDIPRGISGKVDYEGLKRKLEGILR